MLKKKGFTLIELLIVMVIMAILVAIVIGLIGQSATNRAKDVDAKSAMREVQTALEMYMADYGGYPATLEDENLELGADVLSCDSCGPENLAYNQAGDCYTLTYTQLAKPDEPYVLECKQ
ncbi:type II secretion system GspH family protein [Patescibacteria group bacterium]|nr:type II secretion system GspH family protein [Patescibacteria group bacterium]